LALASSAAHASFIPLGVVDGLKVNGSSPDGTYLVGQYLDENDDKIAMRWDITGSDPLEDLGELLTGAIESEARAASGDGAVVVGDSKVEDPNDATKSVKEAFIWEADVMTGLGFLQDDTSKVESEAKAASYDGSTVVGNSKVDDPNDASKSVKQAFIWQGGVMTGLGFLADAAGPFESKVAGVSADGSVVVGDSKTADGKEAFIWTAEWNEMRSVREILEEDLGVDLTGWTLDKAPVMSSDGETIIVLAKNPDGDVEAFVSYVPEPAGGIYAGIAMLAWLNRRRSTRFNRARAQVR
jgi:hypothetical protein